MSDLPTPARPTAGQRRILQFASRANRRLVGMRAPDGAVTYQIIEYSSGADGELEPRQRVVMEVTSLMVVSLSEAGWIVTDAPPRARRWVYRVTEAGTGL